MDAKILGIGIDLCSIARIKQTIKKTDEKFLKRILSAKEIDEYNTIDESSKLNFLAKKWSAKEALAKATTCGITLGFNHITIAHEKSGKPYIELDEIAYKKIAQLTDCDFATHLSLSDEGELVIAMVIIETIQQNSN